MCGVDARAPLAAAVGRSAEAAVLAAAVAEARAGAARCVVVAGEAGIGKTRLLTDLAAAARAAGVAVLSGRAAVSAPVPYGVIAEALRSWCRDHPIEMIGGTAYGPGLRLALPEWPVVDARGELSEAQLRLLALEGVVHVIREIAQRDGATVVILDDLHAADPESVEVARYLANAGISGVAVVLATRRAESALAEYAVDDLARSGAATVIELSALDAPAVAELVEVVTGGPPAADFLAAVVAQTDGVPLLVEELVAAHLRAGSVAMVDGEVVLQTDAVAVPRTIREMVSARLDRLDAYHRAVILAAAVVGDFASEVLSEVSESAAVDAAVSAAAAVGLLDVSGGDVAFRHAIIREAALDTIGRQELVRLHRRAAAALARMGSEPDVLERRARHLLSVGDVDEAAALFTEAARALLARHALLGAEQHAASAADLAEDPTRRAAALDMLAAAVSAQGRWLEALELDRRTSAEYGETPVMRHRMALAALEAGLPELATELIDRAAAAGDTGWSLDLAAGRAALIVGDADLALRRAGAVLDDAAADIDALLVALDLQARASDYLGDRETAKRAWLRQAELAAAHRRTQSHVRAVVQLGKIELFEGGPGPRLREAVELARAAGAFAELAWAEENLAIALTLTGEVDAARDLLDEAIPRARRLRLDQTAYLLVGRAMLEDFAGGEAEPYFAEAEALTESANLRLHTTCGRGDMALRAGQYADAIRWLDEARDIMLATPGLVPMDAPCWLVWALAAAGEPETARSVLAEVRAMPDLDRWQPRSALLEAAEAMLNGDIETVQRIGADRDILWSPLDRGLMRLVGADLVGGEQRVSWLREALDIFEGYGPSVTVTRIRQLLREAGAPVPRKRRVESDVPPHLHSRGVTSREFEVLAQLGTGKSNAQIADNLVISVRTVESHVSSLLAKLDVERRAQLVAIAVHEEPSGAD
jgi:DNA-binding CsgD family transcriptional regulator/tetratricopeptide (TPR) repeat protein/RecA/RadA recombinase